jgi:hypothetical protein
MASNELRQASSNRARALYVQEMCYARNRAVLDLREPGMEQLVAIHEPLVCLRAQY